MELRHLRYFVAVAELENISRAALKLHVSQPALSSQIRDLEDDVGFNLLERTAKSVRLTDAGRAFLTEARAVLQHADEAVKKARAVANAEPTELHVGYSPMPTAKFCRRPYRHFSRPCQTCTSDRTIGATEKFSMGYAMAGFNSD